jgi:hypothetical protein
MLPLESCNETFIQGVGKMAQNDNGNWYKTSKQNKNVKRRIL